MAKLIGTSPNQVSLNSMLGSLAFQSADAARVNLFTADSTVTLNAGTASGVTYLNASKVLTTGSALTFDGTKFTQTASTTAGALAEFKNTSTAAQTGNVVAVNDAGTSLRLTVFGSAAGAYGMLSASSPLLYTSASELNLVADNAAGVIKFGLNGSAEQMRLTSTGLGIGTSSPGQKLSVNGDTLIGTNLFIGNGAGSMVGATSPSLYSPASGTLGISTAGVERARIDSSGNVGIGTSSPQGSLDVTATGATVNQFLTGGAGNNLVTGIFRIGSGSGRGASIQGFRGASSNIHSLDFYTYNSADVFGMRLDSSGNLGIGTSSPAYKLDVNGQVRVNNDFLISDASAIRGRFYGDATGVLWRAESGLAQRWAIGNTEVMRLDSSGNLGLGVTPSAWASTSKALQVSTFVSVSQQSSGAANFGFNFYEDAANAFKYISTDEACRFSALTDGGFGFFTAPSGTAGNAISFTQAMDLATSGGASTLTVNSAINTASAVRLTTNGGLTAGMFLANPTVDHSLGFQTNATERARITSTGAWSFGSTGTATGIVGQVLTSSGSGGVPTWSTVSGGINYTRITTNTTLVDKQGVIADTSGGTFTVTLPLTPAVGAQVSVVDGANWGTTNLTIARNGSTIEALTEDLVLDIGGVSVHLIYDGITWNVYTQVGGQGGTAVTLTGTQTLTNKTLTSPVISTISNTGVITLPTSTDTLVGRATTDTLTNKTLQSGVYTSVVDQTGSVRGGVTTVAALNIDCSLGNFFTKTIAANSTFTVSNVPASRAYAFTLEVVHTSGTITWFSGVQWPNNNTAPTLTTGKVHLFTFVTDDGGTTWRGASQINYNS